MRVLKLPGRLNNKQNNSIITCYDNVVLCCLFGALWINWRKIGPYVKLTNHTDYIAEIVYLGDSRAL